MRLAAVVLVACTLFAGPPLRHADAAQLSTSGSALVVVIPGDKQFHQPGCPLVRKAGSNVRVMKQAEAERRGLKPHDCGQAADPHQDAAAAANAATVYVQPGDKHYHKAGCQRLTANAMATTVEKAAPDHWPCPVCKPPVRKRAK